ncbi:MAG: hypothetical protein IH596_09065 [Bacteroidales bacterium]|nr:hypothetical protein [Bacteroidales bacterium]
MKKQIYLIIIVLLLCQFEGAGQKFYILGSGGYSFGFLREFMPAFSTTAQIKGDTIFSYVDQNETHRVSFGSGASFSLGIGTTLNNYLSIELTGFINACHALKFKTSEYYNYPNEKFFIDFNESHTYKGGEFGLIPAIKFRPVSGNITPYAKVGLLISCINLTYTYEGNYLTTHPQYYPTSHESYTYEMKRKLNLGANVAIGVDFYLIDLLSIFVEANGNFINYVPNKAVYTEYIVNGKDELKNLTLPEREVEFVNSFSSTGNQDITEPSKQLKITVPFSSLGLQAGIRFNFYR